MKFRIYVDEVGNPDLESTDDPNHRFLSLTGIVLELGYIENIVHPEMEAIKSRFFHHHPDEPVIFHRKEMLQSRGSFSALKDQNIRQEFDTELLDLLRRWDYAVISVCMDKKKHKEQYTTWRYDPYHYCLAVLLERFIFFLQQQNSKGDVLAESRGGKEDIRLKKAFRRLWESGTDYVNPETFQTCLTSRELKVKPKANNIAGLQIADIVAHPSRNEILRENGFSEVIIAPFAQEIIAVLQSKYYRREGNVYGKKFL
jgi:hypothetical protein